MADFSTDPEPAPDPQPEPQPDPTPVEIDWSRFGEDVNEDFVSQAVATQRALATEEGVTDYFVQAGLALGLTPDQMTALFDTPTPAVDPNAPPAGDPEPDKPLTREDILQLIKETAVDPAAAAQQASQAKVIQGVITGEMARLEVPDDERASVLRHADKYLKDGEEYEPEKAKEAIEKGYADYTKMVEAAAKRIFDRRAAEGETLPNPLSGGGSPGGEAEAEPKNTEEASARVRAKLRSLGLI